MAIKSNHNILAVVFACADTIRKDDLVEISGAGAVAVPTAAGSIKIVGNVAAHDKGALTCTVDTQFREYRYGDKGRTAGAAIPAGTPFVASTDGKVIAYNDATHDSAAILGLAVTAAAADGDVIETLEF